MSHHVNRRLTIRTNEAAKKRIKQAMLNAHATQKSKRFSVAKTLNAPKPVLVTVMVVVLLASTLFGVNLSRNPLTAEKVIANALEAIDKSQSKGQWQYMKTKEVTMRNGKPLVTYSESWMHSSMYSPEGGTEQPNFSYKTVLADGRILSESVMIDGKSYERDTRELVKEVLGFDPYASSEISESGGFLSPGFKKAGLEADAYEKLSMKEIDDALKAVDEVPIFEPTYKNLDFPAYTMKPAELNKLMDEHADDTAYMDALFGGSDNYKESEYVFTHDGRTLSGEEAEQYKAEQQAMYQNTEALRTGSLEDKKKALEALRNKQGMRLIMDAKWDDRSVIGIDLSQGSAGGYFGGFSQIIYVDAKTYQLVGEEYSYDASRMEGFNAAQLTAMMPESIRITYLEQYFTDEKPTFSIEGLIPGEELYPAVKPADE